MGLLGVALVLAGCQAPVIERAPAHSGDLILEGRRIIANAPIADKNLWRFRVAMVALKEQRYDEARELLDAALPSAGTMLEGGQQAERARSWLGREREKVFYGEPYERAMGWFYRGMLYWRDGEPDNARACYRTAQLLDAAAAQSDRGDWVLLDYLDGYATAKLGGDGGDALVRARATVPTLPDFDTAANVLVFLQFGFGPVKRSGGDVGEGLTYGGGYSRTQSAVVRANGGHGHAALALDDLTHQATTRGPRQFDLELARKAAVKKTGDTVGDIGFFPGLILTQPEETREIGLGLLGFGLAGKALGGTIKPGADTRSWNNLPQYLAFTALRLPAGEHELEIDFYDADGNAISGISRQLRIQVKAKGDTVVFVAEK